MAVPLMPFVFGPWNPLDIAVVARISGCDLALVASNGVISLRSRYGRTRDWRRNLATIVRALRAIMSFQYMTSNAKFKFENR